MFKNNKKIIYIFAGLLLLIIGAQYFIPQPPDWSRNYLSKSKSFFGCYAIYNLLQKGITSEVEINNNSFYQLNQNTNFGSLLIINDEINFNNNDVKSLYEYLKKGNTVFIAANYFNGELADSLRLATEFNFADYLLLKDSLLFKNTEELKFTATNHKNKKYNYPRLLNASYFTNFDSTRFSVLAYSKKMQPCLIHTKIGKGSLYLMSVPDVFGNYLIVNHDSRFFVYTMLSRLSGKKIIWDEYYKTYNVKRDSQLKFIFDSDALYSAYLLIIIGIIVYMIFESKRKQRPIEIITPVTNSTLDFVNVISNVYYNSKNHKHIAIEKIKYFYETVRKKYNVSTVQIDQQFVDEITTLSGIEKNKVQQLFRYCEQIKNADSITEYDLVELNRQIHNFNKNSLR